jgi:hypothetical protein
MTSTTTAQPCIGPAKGSATSYSYADLDGLIARMTGDEKHAPSSTQCHVA